MRIQANAARALPQSSRSKNPILMLFIDARFVADTAPESAAWVQVLVNLVGFNMSGRLA